MAARDRHGTGAPWGDDFQVVGKPHRKVDGMAKATGAAVYTDDIQLPGMLHAKILRSPHPHANIVSIDTSKAEALEGVHGVLVGAELPIKYGVIPWTQDENVLAVDKVRFIGDEVAAVAAVDEDTANAALDLIEVEYEVLHAYLDPYESLERSDPTIHESKKNNNISKHVELEFGEVDKAFEEAEVTLEGEYFFHGTAHAPIETHCAVAQVAPDGHLTLWSATQITHYVHRALARVLELDPARIRVIQPVLGGAFGGKSDPFALEFVTAKLAQKTGRPVKMLWTREEAFYAHRGRHPMHMRYRTAARRDGRVTGVDAKILIDGGSYSSFGLVTTYYSGQLLTGPYDFPSYRFDSTRVFTNKPPCGPKRGHGSVQPRFAFEVQLDEVADRSWASTRSRSAARTSSRARTTQHGQRSAHHVLRLRRCASTIVEEKLGLEGALRPARARARPRRRGLDVHLGHQLPGLSERDAPGGHPAQGRPVRPRDGASRAATTSARARTRSSPTSWPRSSASTMDHDPRGRGRHGPVPGRPRRLLVAA